MSQPGVITLVGPDGETAPFKPADADNALAHGWRVATDKNVEALKNAGGFSGGAKALVEGGARGLTAGLSDLAEVKLGITTPEAIQARREANPVLSTAGTIAGGIGLAAGTGGLLGAAGLTGIGGALATGALSGGIAGGVGELSDQLLEQNKPLRGEEIAQHALAGTLLGTLGAGVGEALGAGVRGIGRAAGRLADDTSAERYALQALKPSAKQMMRLEEKGLLADVGRKIIDDGALKKGAALPKYYANKEALQQTGKAIEEALSTSENPVATESLADISDNLRRLAAKGEFETKAPVWKKRLNLLADHIDDSVGDAANQGPFTAKQLHHVRQEIDAIMQAAPGGTIGKGPRELAEARRLVNETLNESMGPEFADLNREYGLGKEYGKLLESAAGKELKAPSGLAAMMGHSETQLPMFAAASGHPAVAAAAVGGNIMRKYLASPATIANALDNASAKAFLRQVATKSQTEWTRGIDTLLSGAAAGAVGDAGHIPSTEDYDHLSSVVQSASENPTLVASNLTQAVGDEMHVHHPEIADHASATSARAINYLNNALPKSPLPAALLDSSYVPSDAQKAEWLDAYRAVMRPQTVITHPTEASMAALRTVYPETAAAVTTKILDGLRGKQVTYQQQLRLATILGANVGTLTSPQFVSGMQQILSPPAGDAGHDQKGAARTASATRAKARKMSFDKTVQAEQNHITRLMENS